MVRLTRIYTRTGDAGTTGLVGTTRVSKADPLIAAIGDVDEVNSAIGVAATLVPPELAATLARIQNDLFDLGAELATPVGTEGGLRVVAAQVAWLEGAIDAVNADLAPLNSFVLPGGSPAAAALHLARAVARRAERAMVAAGVAPGPAASYVNRLSDFLFVAARAANGAVGDVLWKPGDNR